jgi:hypothetical protein
MLAELVAGAIKGCYDVVRNMVRGRKPETVQDHIAKNEFIQERLEEILQKINASRVYVTQFHNGGYFYSGSPMQRCSVTYEAVNNWVAPTIGDLQNRLVSEYPLLHSTLLNTGEFYIPDVSKMTENGMRQKFEKRGIKTFYAVGIWDLSGNKVGNISVNYVGINYSMSDEEKNAIQDFAKQIVGYIVPLEQKKDSLISKIIIGIIGLTCASQLIYFLNNALTLLHNLGPTALAVVKELLNFL